MNGEPDNRPQPKKEKIPPSYLWVLGGLGGAFIALFLLSVQWKDTRKVARVVVEGARYFSEKDTRVRAGVPDGVLLDTVSLSAIRRRLVSHPYIRDAQVNRAYPDAVTITIEERVPVASFTIGGAIRYIDAEGVVLPYMESGVPYDLPGVTGIAELGQTRIGQAVGGDEYFEALGILDAALATDSSVYRLISEVDMKNGGDVYLYSSESAVPIIFGHGDERRKFAMLHAFWDKFVREGGPENLEYVDLRFSDQVVVKWHHKPQRSVNLSSM